MLLHNMAEVQYCSQAIIGQFRYCLSCFCLLTHTGCSCYFPCAHNLCALVMCLRGDMSATPSCAGTSKGCTAKGGTSKGCTPGITR